jgi:hypothetical protein
MAFLRFNRDTRGYEHFYLVQQTTNRRGKVRPRLLYWFRTPPNVKVGRQPFDEAVRRALEAQNPDIHFDWQAIVDTPIPPPVEVERWRERRRFERAARQAAAEETIDAGTTIDSPVTSPQPVEVPLLNGDTSEAAMTTETPNEARVEAAPVGPIDAGRRRRRRRRGRRGRSYAAGTPEPSAAPDPGAQPPIENTERFDPEGE